MRKTHLAIIGYGQIAESVHAPILSKIPQANIVAIAETDEERYQLAIARFPQVKVTKDYREILQDQQVDAVVVCLPNLLHIPFAIEALKSGKHVYLEKPMGIQWQECLTLQKEIAQYPSLILAMGFNRRFDPLFQEARKYITEGILGNIIHIKSTRSRTTSNRPTWRDHRASGGGALLELAPHHFDLVYHLLGIIPQQVFCSIYSEKTEQDQASVQLTLSKQLTLQSFFSLCSYSQDTWELIGEKHKMVVNRLSGELDILENHHAARRFVVRQKLRTFWRNPSLLRRYISPERDTSYYNSLQNFVRCTQKKATHPGIQDGLLNMALIMAAEKSASSNQPVAVDKIYDIS